MADQSDEEEELDIKDIPALMKKIPNTYHSTRFAPRPVVLDVMRSSNVHKELQNLEDHCKNMDGAMNSVVNSYYQGFNKSIRSYSQILSYITDSQQKVDSLKVDLEKAKALLICRNQDLKIMWKKVLEYHYMLQILEKIEDLETVPNQLSVFIAENHFLHAAELLVKSVKIMVGEDLLKVGALAELRQSLIEQRNLFHEVLIDKLHSLVYVKNVSDDNKDNPAIDHGHHEDHPSSRHARDRLENDPRKLLERATSKAEFSVKMDAENFDEEAVEDLTVDPSQNTKQFMRLLVEALNTLGQLPSSVSIVNSKISPEMKKVIQLISTKVIKAHENRSIVDSDKDPLLVDLINTVFDKCVRIMHNHIQMATMFNGVFGRSKTKALLESKKTLTGSGGISRDAPSSGPSLGNYSVEYVWEVIQKEITEMLKGILGDSQGTGMSTSPGPAATTTTTEEKKLFSFANSTSSLLKDPKAPPAGHPSASMLHSSSIKPSPYNITSIYPALIRFDEQVTRLMATHSKGMPSPNPGKSVLRNYIDDFIQRAFLQHIKTDYSKRVHNSIEGPEAFKCVNKTTSVLERESARPLLHSVVDIYHLIKELVTDVTAMPHYANEFIAVADSILGRFLEKCQFKMDSELKDVLTGLLLSNNDFITVVTSDPLWKAIKMFSHRSRRSSISGSTASGGGSHSSSHGDEAEEDWTSQEEEEYLMEAATFYATQAQQTPGGGGISAVTRSQLITEIPKLSLFASLSDSLDWLANRLCDITKELTATQVPGMGHLKTPMGKVRQGGARPRSGGNFLASSAPNGIPAGGGNSLNASYAGAQGSNSTSNIGSVLGNLTPGVLDALDRVNQNLEVTSRRFNFLADRALLVLRTEFRLHCLFFLEGLKRTSYVVEETRQEPDIFISELNASLSSVEETMAHHLPPLKARFLFDRLAPLIARLLIKGLASIKGINKNGVFKMFRNVFALQQNLTNIVVRKEQHFDRVRKYYDLLNLTDEELQAHIADVVSQPSGGGIGMGPIIKSSHFTAEDYRMVVEVQKFNKRLSPAIASSIEQKLKMIV